VGVGEMSGATLPLSLKKERKSTLSPASSFGFTNIGDEEIASRPSVGRRVFWGYHQPVTVKGNFNVVSLSAATTATREIVLEERLNGEGAVSEKTEMTYRSLSPRPAFSVTVQYCFGGRKKPMLYPLDDEEVNDLLELE
jgi:hypothetical protein